MASFNVSILFKTPPMFLLMSKKITLIRIYSLILNGIGTTHLGMVVQLDQDGCCLEVVKHISLLARLKN